MLSEVAGILLDVGLGAVALSMARSLKGVVGAISETLAKVAQVQADHERRITNLEGLRPVVLVKHD